MLLKTKFVANLQYHTFSPIKPLIYKIFLNNKGFMIFANFIAIIAWVGFFVLEIMVPCLFIYYYYICGGWLVVFTLTIIAELLSCRGQKD